MSDEAMPEVPPEPATPESVELAALVERECGFLRITGKDFFEELDKIRKRRCGNSSGGLSMCVVFHCRGLPWAKRAKWLVPLLWSVAAVLKLRNCIAKVQAGELYVKLPSACSFVRLDFIPTRD
jgi:hypothetical protein